MHWQPHTCACLLPKLNRGSHAFGAGLPFVLGRGRDHSELLPAVELVAAAVGEELEEDGGHRRIQEERDDEDGLCEHGELPAFLSCPFATSVLLFLIARQKGSVLHCLIVPNKIIIRPLAVIL